MSKRVDFHGSLSHDFRTHLGHRASEFVPPPARLLRPGSRPPTALVRHRSNIMPSQFPASTAETPHSFPRGPRKIRPTRRAAPSSRISRWQLGVGIQHGAKVGTDATVLKVKRSLNWTGSYAIVAALPSLGTSWAVLLSALSSCFTKNVDG